MTTRPSSTSTVELVLVALCVEYATRLQMIRDRAAATAGDDRTAAPTVHTGPANDARTGVAVGEGE